MDVRFGTCRVLHFLLREVSRAVLARLGPREPGFPQHARGAAESFREIGSNVPGRQVSASSAAVSARDGPSESVIETDDSSSGWLILRGGSHCRLKSDRTQLLFGPTHMPESWSGRLGTRWLLSGQPGIRLLREGFDWVSGNTVLPGQTCHRWPRIIHDIQDTILNSL